MKRMIQAVPLRGAVLSFAPAVAYGQSASQGYVVGRNGVRRVVAHEGARVPLVSSRKDSAAAGRRPMIIRANRVAPRPVLSEDRSGLPADHLTRLLRPASVESLSLCLSRFAIGGSNRSSSSSQ